MTDTATQSIISYGIDGLENLKGSEVEGADLHNHLYNEDYFIIGYGPAREFLNEYGVFEAINEIKNYEQDNFGEVSTDFSDEEKCANMLAYIKGEEALGNCPTLQKRWDAKLSDRNLDQIAKELKAQL